MKPIAFWVAICAALLAFGVAAPFALTASWWPRRWSEDNVRRICREEIRRASP
jgi:hypothetical protein